jgi:hypothetical protein
MGWLEGQKFWSHSGAWASLLVPGVTFPVWAPGKGPHFGQASESTGYTTTGPTYCKHRMFQPSCDDNVI